MVLLPPQVSTFDLAMNYIGFGARRGVRVPLYKDRAVKGIHVQISRELQ